MPLHFSLCFYQAPDKLQPATETTAWLIKLKVLITGNVLSSSALESASQLDSKDRLLMMITPQLEIKLNNLIIYFDFTPLIRVLCIILHLSVKYSAISWEKKSQNIFWVHSDPNIKRSERSWFLLPSCLDCARRLPRQHNWRGVVVVAAHW